MHSMYASCLLQCLSETVGILFTLLRLGCVLGIISTGAYSPPPTAVSILGIADTVFVHAGLAGTYVESFSLHCRCK